MWLWSMLSHAKSRTGGQRDEALWRRSLAGDAEASALLFDPHRDRGFSHAIGSHDQLHGRRLAWIATTVRLPSLWLRLPWLSQGMPAGNSAACLLGCAQRACCGCALAAFEQRGDEDPDLIQHIERHGFEQHRQGVPG